MNTIDFSWVKQQAHHRPQEGHKKTFGHVLVIAGSEGKAGAAILCARAALHSGCGMVTAMIPKEAVAPLLSESPEIMYITDQNITEIHLAQFDAIAIGPGLGLSSKVNDILYYVIEHYNGPIVIDADALTLLANNLLPLKSNHILTPHPGEFSRLQGFPYDPAKREGQASDFVSKHPVNLVLKGAQTIVVAPNGDAMINTTGNDGMATAGSGDVLTGIISSLCAQGYASNIAAPLGVFMHGMAGDLATQKISKASLVASDLIHFLGEVRVID